MIGVQSVAGAAVVGVASAVLLEDVVCGVVQTAEAQGRPALIALGGVVEHDVEDDLGAGPVQRLDHVAELVHRAERIFARAARLVRREERDRRIAPIVDLAGRTIPGVELEHRQQLHRGDPELLEIRDLLDQARERAAGLLADAGAGVAGEAAHVHLVHDGLRGRPPQRGVAFPVVRSRIDHHALHRGRTVVTCRAGRGAIVAIRDRHATTIRVKQDLGGVEAHTVRRIPRALDAIAVDLAWRHARDEHVPVVVGAIGGRVDPDHPRGLRAVVDVIEQQQLDSGGVLGEHAEVHAVAARRRSERRAGALLREALGRVRSPRDLLSLEHHRHGPLRGMGPMDPSVRGCVAMAPGRALPARSRPRTRRSCGRSRTSRIWRR
jgi:hypothetical protein